MSLHLQGVLYFNANLKSLPKNGYRHGPTIIHHSKSADTYESAMRCIAKECDWENKSEIHNITDGEPALIAACLKSFSKCSLLICTRHFEANCKNLLMDMSIKRNIKDVR